MSLILESYIFINTKKPAKQFVCQLRERDMRNFYFLQLIYYWLNVQIKTNIIEQILPSIMSPHSVDLYICK